MPVMEQEKLLTVKDIAEMTGKTEGTIKRLFNKGDLKGTRIGGQWYMTRENWRKKLEEDRKKWPGKG